MGDDPGAPAAALDVTRHARYFRYCLSGLQEDYAPLDTSRMTAVYFCVSALDFLGALDSSVRERVAAWVLGHQFRPSPTAKGRDAERAGGFRGGPFLGHPFGARGETSDLDAPHIAMSYTALAVLNTVGDDLSRVDRAGVLASVAALARPDGSPLGGETDVRFVYCACAVSHMLGSWQAVDVAATTRFVERCLTYEGAFGLEPSQEAHGGGTYCAIASLRLMGRLDAVLPPGSARRARLLRWLVQRQVTGFQGRPCKDPDTCYSFWCGAALAMLGAAGRVQWEPVITFHRRCEYRHGGFMKVPDSLPDIVHSYYSVCAHALAGSSDVSGPLDPELAITAHARAAADANAARLRAEAGEGEGF